MYDIQEKVNAVMEHYRRICRRKGYEWVNWADSRRPLRKTKANVFFMLVMLNLRQRACLARARAEHFVAKHFNETDNLWNEIINLSDTDLIHICQNGYYKTSYAVSYQYNKFPKWLKTNARIMIDEYDSDPGNIWKNAELEEIRKRFEEFAGIGTALSRWATNTLVREYGVAGGRQVKAQLFLKPDVLLRRVMCRVGFIENEAENTVLKKEREMKENRILRSPADFDAAIWDIGQKFCKQNPKCEDCPINHVCDYWNG